MNKGVGFSGPPVPGEHGDSRLELTLGSSLAASVLSLIRSRFDNVTTEPGPGSSTVLTVTHLDASGERALLNLLWDTGHQIVSLSSGHS